MGNICEAHVVMGGGAVNVSSLLKRNIMGMCSCLSAGPPISLRVGIFITQLVVIHIAKGFSIVNE